MNNAKPWCKACKHDEHGQTVQPEIGHCMLCLGQMDGGPCKSYEGRPHELCGCDNTEGDLPILTPPVIVQDYREYTAEEILHGIVKFTEQAGWGDPANLGHWLGAAQRWAREAGEQK